ncbi:unnamed protein product [Coregonus sp. 'balchen']|nr:unnamed protein product [Coregonus sp. 'balchen']
MVLYGHLVDNCLWCMTNGTCTDYPVSYILPPPAVCKLSQARWGVCWVNFEALIIAMAVLGGTILISITVCCCCCCCCKKRQSGPDRDEERFARRREDIRQRADERKVERKVLSLTLTTHTASLKMSKPETCVRVKRRVVQMALLYSAPSSLG